MCKDSNKKQKREQSEQQRVNKKAIRAKTNEQTQIEAREAFSEGWSGYFFLDDKL